MDDAEGFWRHTFNNELRVNTHAVERRMRDGEWEPAEGCAGILVALPADVPTEQRATSTEIMFDLWGSGAWIGTVAGSDSVCLGSHDRRLHKRCSCGPRNIEACQIQPNGWKSVCEWFTAILRESRISCDTRAETAVPLHMLQTQAVCRWTLRKRSNSSRESTTKCLMLPL